MQSICTHLPKTRVVLSVHARSRPQMLFEIAQITLVLLFKIAQITLVFSYFLL